MEQFKIFYKIKNAIEFAERWINKTTNYQDSELSDCFDKFFSLYVAYNHIYNTINYLAEYYYKISFYKMDSAKAVDGVANFMEKKTILSSSNNEDIKQNLGTIVSQVERHNLSIFADDIDGKSTKDLIKNLKRFNSKNRDIKNWIKLILKLIYKLRCNMFHGEKEYESYQKELLSSTNKILKKLIDILILELKKEYNALENRLFRF